MMEERETVEIEADTKEWKIYFDLKPDKTGGFGEKTVLVKFTLNRSNYPLTSQDLENLKQDLIDFGKFRIIKQGKEFLEK